MKQYQTHTLNKFIRETIYMYRKHFDITAEKLAEYLNVSTSFIQQVECGQRHYNASHLFLIYLLFKEKKSDFEISNFFPNEKNYYTIKNFNINKYSTFDILKETIIKEITLSKNNKGD